MSDLIDRVARAANWTFDTGCLCWLPKKGSVLFYADEDALLDAGLVFLLRELLDAGWVIKKLRFGDYKASISYDAWRGGEDQYADTLEGVVMAAYLAHKGER